MTIRLCKAEECGNEGDDLTQYAADRREISEDIKIHECSIVIFPILIFLFRILSYPHHLFHFISI